jgi:hypothetical protein
MQQSNDTQQLATAFRLKREDDKEGIEDILTIDSQVREYDTALL